MTSLVELCRRFNVDKWDLHWYAQHYEDHFSALRLRPIRLLEIGIGGYSDPASGGSSLKMWREFFPNALICGIDLYDKSAVEDDRIRCFQGDQADPAFLQHVVSEMGGVDIVIDDGSHMNADVIASFETLFALLNDGGYYVVEDVETSYWEYYGGTSDPASDTMTTIRYFTALTEHLNWQERISPGYSSSYLDDHLFAMYFYHNMVWLRKKRHGEDSVVVVDNERFSNVV